MIECACVATHQLEVVYVLLYVGILFLANFTRNLFEGNRLCDYLWARNESVELASVLARNTHLIIALKVLSTGLFCKQFCNRSARFIFQRSNLFEDLNERFIW
jgi:hypothetical protein